MESLEGYDHEKESAIDACGIKPEAVSKCMKEWTSGKFMGRKKKSEFVQDMEEFILSEHDLRVKAFVLSRVFMEAKLIASKRQKRDEL